MTHQARRDIKTSSAAEAFCDDLARTVEAMIGVLDRETAEMRGARYEEAFALGAEKSALASRYALGLDTLRQQGKTVGDLAPAGTDRLRRLHSELEIALQSNVTVLTAARTVSETLLRDLTEAASRRQRTSGYGQDARSYTGPAPNNAVGFNVAT